MRPRGLPFPSPRGRPASEACFEACLAACLILADCLFFCNFHSINGNFHSLQACLEVCLAACLILAKCLFCCNFHSINGISIAWGKSGPQGHLRAFANTIYSGVTACRCTGQPFARHVRGLSGGAEGSGESERLVLTLTDPRGTRGENNIINPTIGS